MAEVYLTPSTPRCIRSMENHSELQKSNSNKQSTSSVFLFCSIVFVILPILIIFCLPFLASNDTTIAKVAIIYSIASLGLLTYIVWVGFLPIVFFPASIANFPASWPMLVPPIIFLVIVIFLFFWKFSTNIRLWYFTGLGTIWVIYSQLCFSGYLFRLFK